MIRKEYFSQTKSRRIKGRSYFMESPNKRVANKVWGNLNKTLKKEKRTAKEFRRKLYKCPSQTLKLTQRKKNEYYNMNWSVNMMFWYIFRCPLEQNIDSIFKFKFQTLGFRIENKCTQRETKLERRPQISRTDYNFVLYNKILTLCSLFVPQTCLQMMPNQGFIYILLTIQTALVVWRKAFEPGVGN